MVGFVNERLDSRISFISLFACLKTLPIVVNTRQE